MNHRSSPEKPKPHQSLLCVLSGVAVEVLEEDHRVMFLKLFEQPPPLFGGHALVLGDVLKKLLEALQGGSLALVFILLWCHLLAEGEHCNTQ